VSEVPGRESNEVAALALMGLLASFLVSYVKARAESLGFSCDVGLAERAERLILMIVGLIFNIVLVPVLVILTAASLITVVQRLVHVRAQAKARGA
jgi:CDP-diacylglycerol---glycerol-3-phosphate 3-phosphatidyltransferase